ncbi:MAG TPA: GtrA family protein [Rhizomicrobium sp.]|nr:GtrA family protein [Rhizomicrobium sp.]
MTKVEGPKSAPNSRAATAWAEFARLLRFGLAGVANTLVGLGIIAALDLGMHVRPAIANAAGYAAGIALSFVLSRQFVFRSRRPASITAPRFLLSAAIAFAANQAALAAAGHFLGGDPASRLAAQVCGMVFYTLTFFVLGRFWIFKG